MLTPAEELLAAVKEHATAESCFTFTSNTTYLHIEKVGAVSHVSYFYDEQPWIFCDFNGNREAHPTASSAVQSAFARARGKQP